MLETTNKVGLDDDDDDDDDDDGTAAADTVLDHLGQDKSTTSGPQNCTMAKL